MVSDKTLFRAVLLNTWLYHLHYTPTELLLPLTFRDPAELLLQLTFHDPAGSSEPAIRADRA